MPIIRLQPGPGGTVSPVNQEDDASQNLFTGFLKSAVSSAAPELIGMDPLDGVEKFRRDNPWLGVGSQVAGLAVPYTGWFKAAKGIGYLAKAEKAVDTLTGGAKAAPILSRAAKAVAIDAPFEVGRTLISTQTGDNTGKVATDAATNLALAGVLGGGIGAVKAMGRKVPSLPEIDKSVDLKQEPVIQLRQLKKAKADGVVTNSDAAEFWINRLSDNIRRQTPVRQEGDSIVEYPHILPLEGQKDSTRLGRLFRPAESATISTKRFVPEDFSSNGAFTDALAQSGLLDKEDFIQFPRLVTATGKGVGNAESSITSALTQVAPDTWMQREANDGLYVMAKRLEQGTQVPAAGGKGKTLTQDKWVLFKTDTPGQFVPLGDAWSSSLARAAKWGEDVTAPIGTPINDALQGMIQQFPLQNYNDTLPTGKLGSFLQDTRNRLGIDRMNGAAKQAAEATYNFTKAHVSPAMFQFSKSPRAAYIFNVARNLYHYADAESKTILEGEAALGKSLWHQVLNGPTMTGKVRGVDAINPMIDRLTQEELNQVWLARAQMWKPERVKEAIISGEISPAAGDAIGTLNALDAEQFGNVMKTQDAFGIPVSKPSIGHMMISNTWRGSIRVPVTDADGKLVILASGRNRAEALAQADEMVKGGKAHGYNWKVGESFHADATTELQQLLAGARGGTSVNNIDLGSKQFSVANALRVAAARAKMKPSTLHERQGVGGYIGQDAPWTKQELKDILASHVQGYQRYQARVNIENAMQGDLLKLMSEDPAMFTQLRERLDDLHGVPSKFAQYQNRVLDSSPLGAILGKDSASKGVAILNSYTHHNQLGLGNISFPLVNAMQPLVTTMPHLAFVLNASPEAMQRAGYYSWNLAADAAGKPKTGVGFLNMARLMQRSFSEMGKPTPELEAHLAQAAKEGQWSSTFNQEVVGQNSAMNGKLKEALEGKGGAVGMLMRWSNLMPNISERFSRVQSFTLGHIVGRDILNLKGEQLYRFAKRFTENSNFAYSTADRARVITGPMGSLFGLYKNWQMHYIGWMLNYLDAGMNQGNWAPLIYQLLGTGATGGIGAMAGFGAADNLSKFLTDKDLMQHVYDNFGATGTDGQKYSDAVYFGLPAFLGASLQGQASSPGANPVRDASMLFSLVQYNRMKDLGTAIGNAWDQYDATGQNPLQAPLVRDNVLKTIAPRSMFRVIQTLNNPDGPLGGNYIRSLGTGYPGASASVGERVLFALGLNPVDVEKQMIVSDKLWRDQSAMKNAVQAYGKALDAAEGDGDATRAIMLRAMADGVPLDSIIKSQKSRRARGSKDVLDRQFSPLKVKGYEDVLGR